MLCTTKTNFVKICAYWHTHGAKTHWRVQAGLQLRQAMFLNASLFNSEAWHGVTDGEIEQIEKVDEALLNAHAKVPIEALYLETRAIPVRGNLQKKKTQYI